MNTVQEIVISSQFEQAYINCVAQAWEDANFKLQFLENPKDALIKIGAIIPDAISVEAHEMTTTNYPIVLPVRGTELIELSEEEAAQADPMVIILRRAIEDETFRAKVIANPKPVATQELGIAIPDFVHVAVYENTDNHIHVVLPPNPNAQSVDGELSDEELEVVAGGKGASSLPIISDVGSNTKQMTQGVSQIVSGDVKGGVLNVTAGTLANTGLVVGGQTGAAFKAGSIVANVNNKKYG